MATAAGLRVASSPAGVTMVRALLSRFIVLMTRCVERSAPPRLERRRRSQSMYAGQIMTRPAAARPPTAIAAMSPPTMLPASAGAASTGTYTLDEAVAVSEGVPVAAGVLDGVVPGGSDDVALRLHVGVALGGAWLQHEYASLLPHCRSSRRLFSAVHALTQPWPPPPLSGSVVAQGDEAPEFCLA